MPSGKILLGAAVLLGFGFFAVRALWPRPASAVLQIAKGRKTVADRLAEHGPAVRDRLAPDFSAAGVAYPPRHVAFVGLKDEKRLEIWVAGGDGAWKPLKNYPILGLSGTLGPKLREGDRQVPEGIYRIESLNPNSLYHLSLRLDYPNADDRRRGIEDGRDALGSDIMIHGSDCSIGCLAMGDPAAEDLFLLAADAGIENVSVLLCPVDFRIRPLPAAMPGLPPWTPDLYATLRDRLVLFGP